MVDDGATSPRRGSQGAVGVKDLFGFTEEGDLEETVVEGGWGAQELADGFERGLFGGPEHPEGVVWVQGFLNSPLFFGGEHAF